MIYTITLNPAIDSIISINDELTKGKNNRIEEKLIDIGGKGTHVSIGLTLLDVDNKCLGITGEIGSEDFFKMLNEYNVDVDFMLIKNHSIRNNIVITDYNEGSYLISEKGIELTEEIIDKFIDEKLYSLTEKDTIVLSGNPSQTTSPTVFNYLLDRLLTFRVSIFVDVSGEYLQVALTKEIKFIKPNQYEFSDIVGQTVNTVEECIKSFKSNFSIFKNVQYVFVSLGDEGSVMLSDEESLMFIPPRVNNVNDTGAGDAFVSGLVYGVSIGKNIEDLGKFATAVGAANVERRYSSGFEIERISELLPKVKVIKLED